MDNARYEVACPTCSKLVVWSEESAYRPFCSKRCQLIDLGEWANEQKVISDPDAEQLEWIDENRE